MKKILFFTLLAGVIVSCKKTGGLEDKTTGLTEEAIFTDSVQTTNFLNRIYVDAGYSFGPSRFAGAGGSGNTELATDNAEGNNNLAVWGNAYAQGTISPSSVINSAYFGTDKDFWNTPYKNIRRVNLLLEKIGGAPFHESTRRRMRAEARFLRAFYYHHMLIAFGGVPLIGDKVFGINDIINIPRGSYEECVAYMVSELDAAAADLAAVTYKDIDFGRVTRGACMALKSRVLLYAASPLFNGGGISKSAVVGYPTFSASRWQQAADAAEAVISTNIYSLNLDNTTRPGNGFYQVFLKRVNSEYIFQYNRPAQKEFEAYYLPPTRTGASIMKPTQSLVEAFPMIDGKAITESSTYNPNDPYVNRDPRLTYSIIYNGLSYINNSSVKTAVYTYMSAGSTIANTTADAYTSTGQFTGYFGRKMCDENISNGLAATTERAWPLIRYAEILLNYAEAINEVGQPEKAVEKLILLRERAGILPGSDNRYGIKANITAEELRPIIQNERRIELAFEDHRFNDIRRWKIASTVLKGFNSIDIITRTGTNTFVHTVSRAPRPLNFRDAMYLLPIPLTEIQKMPLMEQNPEY